MKTSQKVRLMLSLLSVGLLLLIDKVNAQPEEEEIVKYSLIAPSEVLAGKQFQVDVLFTVRPDWYIYAPDGSNAKVGKIETKVIFVSGDLTKVGKLKLPEPIIKDGYKVYEGSSIVMSQAFIASSRSGRYKIIGKITYQTCNTEICLPPVTEQISAIINVK